MKSSAENYTKFSTKFTEFQQNFASDQQGLLKLSAKFTEFQQIICFLKSAKCVWAAPYEISDDFELSSTNIFEVQAF